MKPVRILAIETSSRHLSIALGDDTRVLAQQAGAQDGRHAEQLFDGMEQVLKKARCRIDDLTGVAVSIGPGSFTGIRIGLAAARALAQFQQIPLVGVSSLETLAWGLSRGAGRWTPVIDALRGSWYGATYERTKSGAWKTHLTPRCLPEDTWTKKHRVSGLTTAVPQAVDLLALARPRLRKAKPAGYQKVVPLYLREAAAVERRKGLRRDR